MRSLKTLVLAGVVTIGATAVASAADLGPPPMGLPHPPMAHPIAESGGWYLRGDIGIGALDAKSFEYSDRPAGLTFTSKDFQQQIFGGIGVGYQFNSWLRFDLTGEYRGKTGFSAHDRYSVAGQNCGGLYGQPAAAVTCTNFGENSNRGNISSAVFLANAYLDLGTWSGLTPFVGVGIGAAQHKVAGVTDTGYATNQVTATTIPLIAPVGQSATSATFGTAANKTKTNAAWALMAGVAYDVTPIYKVELGYRYLNLGKFSTGNYTCAGGCATTYSLAAKNLDSHEFKIGMRWMLGGPSYAAAPHPMPMPYPVEPRMIKKF